MSQVLPSARYYPRVSELLTVHDLPDFLSFAQDGLNEIFDRIHYKNFQFSKSYRGDAAFYSLDIVTSKQIKLTLPFGISMVLNPDFSGGDSNISSFPITLQYQWEILAYLKSFNLSNFSFSLEDFYRIGLSVFRLNEDQVMAHVFNNFIEPANPTSSKYQQVVDDINLFYGFLPANNNLLVLPAGEPSIQTLISAIKSHAGIDKIVSLLLFGLYILDSDLSITKLKLQRFYQSIVPEGIEAYIRKIITPKARATFELSAALEFPRNLVKPVYDATGHNPYNSTTGTPFTVIPPDQYGSPKAQLKFAEAVFYADTEQGLGYSLDIALSLITPVQIGNTPLILFIQNLKLDLSKTKNLAEVNLDGRPPEFMGVFIQEALIGFPQFWNHDGTNSTSVIKGRNLIIGTGGISGRVSLEGGVNGSSVFKLGDTSPSGKHFYLSLTSFSMEFKQNAIVRSEISGKMRIPGFKDGNGDDANINVLVSIGNNGDLRITASEEDDFQTIGVENVFEIALRSVSVGRENNKWYIEASGSLKITATIPGVTTDFLKQPIEIKKLRIYQDGSIEFVGGGITLPTSVHIKIGPVSLAMDHISFTSHQALYQGVPRQYFCFGFDGSLNTGGGSVNVRGDGIEFHFTRDSLPFHSYLRIAGIGVDIKIPGNAKKEDADVFISGYLGMKHGKDSNGVAVSSGPEYRGSISIDINKFKIHAKASMNLRPKVPAWIVDVELELGTPLTLAATGLGIYGFRGLVGKHYVASKEYLELNEDDSWYEYLKKKVPPRNQQGIGFEKFDPERNGFSIGVGASIATMGDDGYTFSSKVFIMLSIPEMFLIEGQANVLHKRLGINNESDPPFYAFLVIDKHSIQTGIGVNYKLPEGGEILSLQGEMQMAFFFGNSSSWYINLGKDLPESKRIQARLFTLFDAYAYVMLSSKGIKAGAGAKLAIERKFGPVSVGLFAFIDTSGFISFKPLQIGGAILLGGGVYIRVARFGIEIFITAGLSAEAPKPFIIQGFLEIKIKIAIFKVNLKLEFVWLISKQLNTDEVKLIDTADFLSLPEGQSAQYPFKAINMLSEEAFNLKYLPLGLVGANPETDASWDSFIIPMDSFIDLEFKRPVKPYNNRYGGGISPLPQYIENISPQKARMPQVKHSFIVDNVQIKIWNSVQNTWVDYDPWAALSTAFQNAGLTVNTAGFPFGYWQYNNNPGKYTSLRLLSQTPFAVSNGTPPESFGILSQHMLCEGNGEEKTCQYWNEIENDKIYPCNTVLRDRSLLLDFKQQDGTIGFFPNVFGVKPSLKIKASDSLEIYFKDPMANVDLSLTSLTGIIIKYFEKTFTGNDTLSGIPDYEYNLIAEDVYGFQDLYSPITYESSGALVSKIIIETKACNTQELSDFINVYWSDLYNYWRGDNSALTDWQQSQVTAWLDTYGLSEGNIASIAIVNLCSEWPIVLEDALLPDEMNKINSWIHSYCNNQFSYNTVMQDLCMEWGDILSNYNSYPNLYLYVYKWNKLYCEGSIGLSAFDCCSTYIHEVCWLTETQWSHNTLLEQNNQSFITSGINSLATAINQSLPPIWRPDSSFAIAITTRDEVNAGSGNTTPHQNTYAVGFKTAGTLGFYHKTQPAFLELEQNNRADEYKLSGLQHYIDFERSYPNADGNLLNAKPLYYKNPKLSVFFIKPYVYELFTTWGAYAGNPAREYQLLSLILDPLDQSLTQPVVPAEVMGWHVHMGVNAIPVNALDIETISNVISQGVSNCTGITGVLKPPTMNAEVLRNYDIKPQKLYKAIFKAVENPTYDIKESIVHSYSFETSRYGSFAEHVGSYVRKINDVETGVELTKNAISSIFLDKSHLEYAAAISKLQGILFGTLPTDDVLFSNYALTYDRIVTGILEMNALHPANTTEFNVIRLVDMGLFNEGATGLLIRTPEPFNNPNLPEAEMATTVLVTDVETTANSFVHVFSKDNCSIFITNTSLSMPSNVNVTFNYLMFNGVSYENSQTINVSVNLDMS